METATRLAKVYVYGTDWCEDTRSTRAQLERLGVPYEYIDIERQPEAAEWVRRQNAGRQRTPTVDLGGLILTEPDQQQLREALAVSKLIAADSSPAGQS